ncbi:transcription factor HES-4-A, partial [Octopus sinensis]|uniref:Transcription factor HES-4-A n=1 Tax=Octopus sinensis TaxID=2607531 RepID=A0A6P7UAB4_9MOLL
FQGEQFSKLEKVDILEMTVKYLRFLHQQQQVNLTSDSLGSKYRVPLDLSAEVLRYMNSDETRNRLTDHISKCVRVSNVAAATQNLPNSTTHPSSTSSPTAATTATISAAVPHQINATPQTNDRVHHTHHTGPFVDKPSAHIMLPIASKQSESSFLLAAASSDSQYKTVAVSYTP